MCLLSESNDTNRSNCEGYFSLCQDRDYESPIKSHIIFLSWISDWNSIHFIWKYAGHQLKMALQTKIDDFFWQSWNKNSAGVFRGDIYFVFQYGDEVAWSEIENVWTTLADSWPKNLKIILHFLISICGVNSEPSLLPYVSILYESPQCYWCFRN